MNLILPCPVTDIFVREMDVGAVVGEQNVYMIDGPSLHKRRGCELSTTSEAASGP
jgi:hypothetical protein